MKGKFNRKNTLFSLGLVPLALFALSGNANAADSTININANVVASPCVVEAVKNIDLGDIDATKLATTGTSSAYVSFTISLTECPATTTTATATFNGTASNTDYYANSGTAKNVEIELVTSYSSTNLGNGKSMNTGIDASTHIGNLNVKVHVKNDGKGSAVTPGSVSSAIQMTVTYK
jgi:minor fimbrial subunit